MNFFVLQAIASAELPTNLRGGKVSEAAARRDYGGALVDEAATLNA